MTPKSDLDRAIEALQPFADCVFWDNGDMTIDESNLSFEDWLKARNVIRALKEESKG